MCVAVCCIATEESFTQFFLKSHRHHFKSGSIFTWVNLCHLTAAYQAAYVTKLSSHLLRTSSHVSVCIYGHSTFHLRMFNTLHSDIHVLSLYMAKPTPSTFSYYFTDALNPKPASQLPAFWATSHSNVTHPPHHALFSMFQSHDIIFNRPNFTTISIALFTSGGIVDLSCAEKSLLMLNWRINYLNFIPLLTCLL